MYLLVMNFISPPKAVVSVCLSALLVVSSAVGFAAEKETPALDWQTPPECGTTEDVQNGLTAVLGERWKSGAVPKLNGIIADADGKWRVTINVPSGAETYTRSVTVNTCKAALEVSSLLIALVIDPVQVLSSEDPMLKSSLHSLEQTTESSDLDGENAHTDEVEGTDTKPGQEARALAPTRTLEAQPPKPPEKQKRLSHRPEVLSRMFAAGLSFVADVGTVSLFAPGLALNTAFRRRIFATELLVRYLLPRENAVDGPHGASWVPQAVGISLGAGIIRTFSRFHLMPLIGFGVEGVFAESRRVVSPNRATVWTASAWLGITLEWMAADWFGLRLQPALHYLFTRPRFVIDGIGLVYQPAPVAGVFSFGVIFAF